MKNKYIILIGFIISNIFLGFSQSNSILKKINIQDVIRLERNSLKDLKNSNGVYEEFNTGNFSFNSFSYNTSNIDKNGIYWKILQSDNKIKKVLCFDGKYPENSFVYMIEINRKEQFVLYHIYNNYDKNGWKPKNYNGFVISDKKTGLNLFFGYNHNYLNFMNPIENINRIFLLDSSFKVTKKLLFYKSYLKYKTKVIWNKSIYKYEKSFSTDSMKISGKTTINKIIELMNSDSKEPYKILYMITNNEEIIRCRLKKYPIWIRSAPIYIPCNSLFIDKNNIYYKEIYSRDKTINVLIDDKIRGELECFEWFY